MQTLKAFRGSLAVSLIVLIAVGVLTRSAELVVTAAILAVLEVTLSFDNAVVNAKYLVRMKPFWQRLFLTVGVLIAVFGMRLVFPIVIVGVTAHLSLGAVVDLALNDSAAYAQRLELAKHSIYAFGGVFLLQIFLDWLFEAKEVQWLRPLESLLERIGKLNQLSVVVTCVALLIAATAVPTEAQRILFSGIAGLVTYLLVSGLDTVFAQQDSIGVQGVATAGLSTFLYLEVLDASFSFDGVIGAFAISQNVLVIAAGLGIGAMFVRSLTVYLVRQGTLRQYRFLDHGAHWAIGALAVCLLIELRVALSEAVTGLLGLGFIVAAFTSSVMANRQEAAAAVVQVTIDEETSHSDV